MITGVKVVSDVEADEETGEPEEWVMSYILARHTSQTTSNQFSNRRLISAVLSTLSVQRLMNARSQSRAEPLHLCDLIDRSLLQPGD